VGKPPEPRQFHETRKNSLPIAQASLGDQYSIAATPIIEFSIGTQMR